MGTITDYKLRIVFSKDLYLDDVLVMKDLYNQIGEGFRVRLILADHPNARQIIAVPANFASTVIGKKQVSFKDQRGITLWTVRTAGRLKNLSSK